MYIRSVQRSSRHIENHVTNVHLGLFQSLCTDSGSNEGNILNHDVKGQVEVGKAKSMKLIEVCYAFTLYVYIWILNAEKPSCDIYFTRGLQ